MIHVVELSSKDSKTKKRIIEETHFFGTGKVSLFAEEAREIVQEREIYGICMKRFKGDIVTSGLNYANLNVGDVLTIGVMQLRVTQVGKSCHSSECITFDEQVKCIMQSGVIFGEVKVPGHVSVGDFVSY